MTNNNHNEPVDILLVDDDETFCMVLNNAIERRGYTIVTATNSAEALKLASINQPAYAIVDLRIGDESGLELVENLVSNNPDISIVMLTGYASIATAVQAIKLGAKHYLTKPADADEIIASFDNELDNQAIKPAEQPLSPKRLEWEHLQKVLMDNDGNISATARALGMHRRTLQRKLQKRPVKK
ncbi:MAG: two-component system response regulator [endosymbiont of Galathealinum brachiosum]|uniref:Two-component system response regulator n=1 Tax=endosymbiont of Galathealinum brachiosum TaxID=2200906 RepID=A0A370D8Y2_9GAMM|nr:MAG: two-component system response regulator [endosymbiont of Galathealinum brachiosum]